MKRPQQTLVSHSKLVSSLALGASFTEMGAQHSRLQKRSLRRSIRSIPYATTAVAVIPVSRPDTVRSKRTSILRPLSQGVDRETAEALLSETLQITVDLQQVHQQLNDILRTQDAGQRAEVPERREPHRPLLPQFSFEQRPPLPLWPFTRPSYRASRPENPMTIGQQSSSNLLSPIAEHHSRSQSPPRLNVPNSSRSRSPNRFSSTSSFYSTTSRTADDVLEILPSLTASSSCYSLIDSPIQSQWASISMATSPTSTNEGFGQHESILGPAVALCNELLADSAGSLVGAREVTLDVHQHSGGLGKPLTISVAKHDNTIIITKGA